MEDIIYQRLCGCLELVNVLGSYQNKPAIFFQMIPEAANRDEVYPRILCQFALTKDMEYDFCGMLKIQIEELAETLTTNEIQQVLKQCLNYCFFQGEERWIVRWEKTLPDKDSMKVKTMIFKIMSLKKQTGDLTSVTALNQWIKSRFSYVKMLDDEMADQTWQGTSEEPGVYLRLETLKQGYDKNTWQTTWVDVGIRIYIMADGETKSSLVQKISEKMLQEEKINMSDGGYMMIRKIQYNDSMNPWKTRQFFVEYQYGVLREEKDVGYIKNIVMEENIKL
jgi:hypothetical protein